MTRAEAKMQIDTGWVTGNLAAIFLGFDLDHQRLKMYVEMGALSSRTDGGIRRFKLDEVCALAEKTPQELLNLHFPYSRQRKPALLQKIAVLDTCAKRDEFRRKWDRLHKAVSEWIAMPAKQRIDFGELRLIHQLMKRARDVNGFDVIVKAKQLEKETGLDRESLPKARRGLEDRGILIAERSGTVAWRYRLCDPETRQPLTGGDDEEDVILITQAEMG